jgi:hypothetical protein
MGIGYQYGRAPGAFHVARFRFLPDFNPMNKSQGQLARKKRNGMDLGEMTTIVYKVAATSSGLERS